MISKRFLWRNSHFCIKMKFLLLFIALVFASEHNTESNEELFEQNAYAPILVKIEEDEYAKPKKTKTSQYLGVSYNETKSRWKAERWQKNGKKMAYNGTYKDEETAAHASDTLARKLIANGEQNHKLNFPGDDIKVYPETIQTSSTYIGVTYNEKNSIWRACRWSKNDKKMVNNGYYKDEEKAAHASDTLARKLMANGTHGHKLNFPDDDTEVHPKETNTSQYIGVSYIERNSRWLVYRWSKNKNKLMYNGTYKDEETAAHASDTLARKLTAIGGQKLKLNFPIDTNVYPKEIRKNKRKRPEDLSVPQTNVKIEKF